MLDVFEGYKMIDLSEGVYPGVLKTNGQYYWGRHVRRFEIKQFETATDHCFMHFVDAEIHIGTHVEAQAHLLGKGNSPADTPLETFFGEAIVLKFDKPCAIGPEHFKKVKKGDIVLVYTDQWPCYISAEGGKALLDKGIKMLGQQGVAPDDPQAYVIGTTVPAQTHKYLLANDIPIIENLVNLDKITKERVYFMGLPLKIYDLDSSWIRAVAWEPEK